MPEAGTTTMAVQDDESRWDTSKMPDINENVLVGGVMGRTGKGMQFA